MSTFVDCDTLSPVPPPPPLNLTPSMVTFPAFLSDISLNLAGLPSLAEVMVTLPLNFLLRLKLP